MSESSLSSRPSSIISSRTSSTTFSLLLSLPTELRLSIYTHLLTYPFTLTHPTSLLPIFRSLYTFTPTPLLLCHQLHTETKPRFYALNTFALSLTPCAPLPYPLPPSLAWVTHLVITVQAKADSVPYWPARELVQHVGFGGMILETLMRLKERGREGLLPRSPTTSNLREEMEMEARRLKSLTLRLPLRYCTYGVRVALEELVAQESDSGREGLRLEIQLYGFRDMDVRDVEALLAAVGAPVGVGALGNGGNEGIKRWHRREHWGACGREVSAVLECGDEAREIGKGEGMGRPYNIPQKLRVGETKESGDAWEGGRRDVDVGFLWGRGLERGRGWFDDVGEGEGAGRGSFEWLRGRVGALGRLGEGVDGIG
ncbi:hypothetical protein G7Y79_00007g021500 [Physcia stellaris]|nr:hypothetical protein G7Y79_00007g021500 [Physcia stellaris]